MPVAEGSPGPGTTRGEGEGTVCDPQPPHSVQQGPDGGSSSADFERFCQTECQTEVRGSLGGREVNTRERDG